MLATRLTGLRIGVRSEIRIGDPPRDSHVRTDGLTENYSPCIDIYLLSNARRGVARIDHPETSFGAISRPGARHA